jgi:hypothetical protein
VAYPIDVQDMQEKILIKLDAAASQKSRINGWLSMDKNGYEWI